MTLALIVLVVFLVVWANDSTKKKAEKFNHRKSTITNVQLQDEIYKQNFTKIIADLEKMDKETPLIGATLLDALGFLYELYNLPDSRTDDEKNDDLEKYHKDLEWIREPYNDSYPQDESILTLPQRIWCVTTAVPHVKQLDLLFEKPGKAIWVDDFYYSYDFRGIPSNIYRTVPAKLFGRINVLLTTKDLKAKGFNYSWNRQESDWQRLELELKEYEKKKESYPWLYK